MKESWSDFWVECLTATLYTLFENSQVMCLRQLKMELQIDQKKRLSKWKAWLCIFCYSQDRVQPMNQNAHNSLLWVEQHCPVPSPRLTVAQAALIALQHLAAAGQWVRAWRRAGLFGGQSRRAGAGLQCQLCWAAWGPMAGHAWVKQSLCGRYVLHWSWLRQWLKISPTVKEKKKILRNLFLTQDQVPNV